MKKSVFRLIKGFISISLLFAPSLSEAQTFGAPIVITDGTAIGGSGSGNYGDVEFSLLGRGWSAKVGISDFESIMQYWTQGPSGQFNGLTSADGGDNLGAVVTVKGVQYAGLTEPENGPVSQVTLNGGSFLVTHPGIYKSTFELSGFLFAGPVQVSSGIINPTVDLENLDVSGTVTYDFTHPAATPSWYYVASNITYTFGVPEPGTASLLLAALAGLCAPAIRRRRIR